MGKSITLPKRPLDGILQIEALLRCYLWCCHKIAFYPKITLFVPFTFISYYNNNEVCNQVCYSPELLIWITSAYSESHRRYFQYLRLFQCECGGSIRAGTVDGTSTKEAKERNGTIWSNVEMRRQVTSRSITGKHCAQMLTWRSALGLISIVIPMNVPIFIATQPTQQLSLKLPTPTIECCCFSKDSVKDSLTIQALLYTKHFILVPCIKEQLRNQTTLMNIQNLMFFCFVLSLTFIKVKLQARLKSLRTMKELICSSFWLDVELIS